MERRTAVHQQISSVLVALFPLQLQLQLCNEQLWRTCGFSDFDAFVFGCVSAEDAVCCCVREDSLLFARTIYACTEM